MASQAYDRWVGIVQGERALAPVEEPGEIDVVAGVQLAEHLGRGIALLAASTDPSNAHVRQLCLRSGSQEAEGEWQPYTDGEPKQKDVAGLPCRRVESFWAGRRTGSGAFRQRKDADEHREILDVVRKEAR